MVCTSASIYICRGDLVQAGGPAEQSKGAAGEATPAAPQTPRPKEARPSSLSAAKGVAAKLMQGKQNARAAAEDK